MFCNKTDNLPPPYRHYTYAGTGVDMCLGNDENVFY